MFPNSARGNTLSTVMVSITFQGGERKFSVEGSYRHPIPPGPANSEQGEQTYFSMFWAFQVLLTGEPSSTATHFPEDYCASLPSLTSMAKERQQLLDFTGTDLESAFIQTQPGRPERHSSVTHTGCAHRENDYVCVKCLVLPP